MNTYVTFGQGHTHSINGVTVDKDTVAVIECVDAKDGREKAFEYFGRKFCIEYHEKEFNMGLMKYFPKGLVKVN